MFPTASSAGAASARRASSSGRLDSASFIYFGRLIPAVTAASLPEYLERSPGVAYVLAPDRSGVMRTLRDADLTAGALVRVDHDLELRLWSRR